MKDVRHLPRKTIARWLLSIAALSVLEAIAIVMAIENARGRR